MEIGKYGVNPDYTEHAGTHDDDHRRHDRPPEAAAGRDRVVHERADRVGEAHDLHPLHPGLHDVRTVREHVEERAARKIERHTMSRATIMPSSVRISIEQEPLIFL